MADEKILAPRTVLIEPFDISLYATDDGLRALQNRLAMWLRGLQGPARFLVWQIPADLSGRIHYVSEMAQHCADSARRTYLQEYRRFYEQLQSEGRYQRLFCGLCLWTDPGESAGSVARMVSSALDTKAFAADWPPLFDGVYDLCAPTRAFKHWHLKPVGRPGGRSYFSFLVSHEFHPTQWTFFRPLANLTSLHFPVAIAVDVPRTYSRNDAISAVETTVMAYDVHLSTTKTPDARGQQKMADCMLTLQQLNQGDALHEVQIVIAVAAPTLEALKDAVDEVINTCRPYFNLRIELAEALVKAPRFFASVLSKHIGVPQKPWQVVSSELALFFAPVGFRKMAGMTGVMRGEAIGASSYPMFHDSWTAEKKATHEAWVGLTGSGKTFGLNVMLTREYIENGHAFDLLEPMGHGRLLADTLSIPWYVLSTQHTSLNPLDIMFDDETEQITHVIRLYETLVGRDFSGNQRGNHEKALLSLAAQSLYRNLGGIRSVTLDRAPLTDELCDFLTSLGDQKHLRAMARDLADEIAGLCTGMGPYAQFVNKRTNLDVSFRGKRQPRVFSFHEMASDRVLLAIAYTQVMAAIRRDSLADDTPRIIAVDEVYRLMRHPALLSFLIEAAKTFRTRRKKLIVIDQQMSVFLSNAETRLVLDNCPIRVIFNQRLNIRDFKDPAFQHFHDEHLKIIASLQRGCFLLDITEQGIWFLYARPSPAEMRRFGVT